MVGCDDDGQLRPAMTVVMIGKEHPRVVSGLGRGSWSLNGWRTQSWPYAQTDNCLLIVRSGQWSIELFIMVT